MKNHRLNDVIHDAENKPYIQQVHPNYQPEIKQLTRIPCINKTGQTLHHGHMVVCNGVFNVTLNAWEVITPTADSMVGALVISGNGEDDAGILSNGVCYAVRDAGLLCYIQTSDTPSGFVAGDTVGTQAGSLLGGKGKTGFVFVGYSENDDPFPGQGVRACVGGGGGGTSVSLVSVTAADSLNSDTLSVAPITINSSTTTIPNYTVNSTGGFTARFLRSY